MDLRFYRYDEQSGRRGTCYSGEDPGGVTVARVLHAAPGEAEGGIGALARFMLAARGVPANEVPPLSPGGWYATGTWKRRGVWEKAGPFETAEDAIAHVRERFAPLSCEDI